MPIAKQITEKRVELTPHPAFLIQSMRCIGYTLETALADIIDNSITAKASRISIRYNWDNGTPWIAILDDGCGMSAERLREAMRFGGNKSPNDPREHHDLGRFGLGLKTASLSQCQLLTALTKQAGKVSALSWDVVWLAKSRKQGWLARIPSKKELQTDSVKSSLLDDLKACDSGTVVFWQNLDAIVSDEKKRVDERHFSDVNVMRFRTHPHRVPPLHLA